MDLTEPGVVREATLHSGVASQSATADRAPFNLHARTSKGREAVSDMRLPPRGHDQPRRTRGRPAAHHRPARGAHARKDAG
ncbi:DUF6380 family protein [Streptomyces fodineus]|uniref:DUF6380 family protein n=1 Tax=Streptomyces fodineus TaxID=1904616 RepID=UPI003AAB0F06